MIDYRLPENRRQHWQDLYEFNLRYGIMPGLVHSFMPWLAEQRQWDTEQKLWFAFINGNTQNPVTSWRIFQQFPELPRTIQELAAVDLWFNENWDTLSFDTDRRYQKRDFPASVERYSSLVSQAGSQEAVFKGKTFEECWKFVRNKFYSFGRLAAFSYLEYVWIMGVGPDCDELFLRDLDGSKSHRNGLAIVSGHGDWDWRKDQPVKYTDDMFQALSLEADTLYYEALERAAGQEYAQHVSLFTLESNCCTYKSAYRPNRRYPGVYADMMHDRIRWYEQRLPEYNVAMFWNFREDKLPQFLRQETDKTDPGLSRAKQNHFRETGQVILLDQLWPDRYFDDGKWRKQ